jgi:hypothetical protein
MGGTVNQDTVTPSPGSGRIEVTLDELAGTGHLIAPSSAHVRNVEEMMEVGGVDPTRWRPSQKQEIRTWWSLIGDGKIFRNWYVKAHLERVPEWAAKPTRFKKIHRPKPRPVPRAAAKTILVCPDAHIGFLRKSTGHLTPLHDRRCLDIFVEVCRAKQPDIIFIVGDWLDLAELGRYDKPMEVMDTLDASRKAGHHWLKRIRLAAPNARILLQHGNHDERLTRIIAPHAPALAALKAWDKEHAFLSLPTLLGFDRIKSIEYTGKYGSHVELIPGLSGSHGEMHGRDALRKALAKSTGHVVFGHTHKAMVERIPRWDSEGRRQTFWGATMGTFAHLDGRLPSGSADGRDDYHQAFLSIEVDGDGYPHPTLTGINDGRCFFEGRQYVGNDDTDAISAEFPEYRWTA